MNKIIVILGPTGVGKTKMSIELAKKFNGEIINADSTQVYKGLDIATAKVTEVEKKGIVHHLIDIKNIEEDYSIYDYQLDVRKKIDEIKSKNKTPILVGGSGLYIKSALYNYVLNNESVKNDYSKYSNEELYDMLLEIEPNTKVHINNRKRVERTLDKLSNNEIDNNKGNEILYDCLFIGLTTDRKTLYEKINNRVELMLNNDLEEEARKIYNTNIRTKAVLTPIGYKELFEYFDGNKTKEEAIEKIKQTSRRYAKKQYTWFNNQMDVNWFDVDYNNFDNTVKSVVQFIEKN